MSPVAVAEGQDLDLGPRESCEFYLPVVKEYADKLNALCLQAVETTQSIYKFPVRTADRSWITAVRFEEYANLKRRRV